MKHRSNWRLVLTFFSAVAVAGSGSNAQTKIQDGVELHSGESVSGNALRSTVTGFLVKAGEYFELAVKKSGTDLEVNLLDPDGRNIRAYDCSHNGPIRISEIGLKSGRYLLEVNACDRAVTSDYQATFLQLKLPTRFDRLRVDAERLSADADSLVAEYREQSTRSAIQKYDQAIKTWATINDSAQEVYVLNTVARLYRELGDLARATDYVNRALLKAQGSGSPIGEAETYLSLAMIYTSRGDADKSTETCLKALAVARSIGNQGLEAEVQYLLGNIYYDLVSDHEKATKALEQARSIWTETGNRIGQARSLIWRAATDFDLSRFDSGPELAKEALSISKSLRDRRVEGQALILLGFYQSRIGRIQEALNLYEDARPFILDSGDAVWEVALLNRMAWAQRDLGESRSALELFKMALSKNESLSDRLGIANSLFLMGVCYFDVGDMPQALSHLNRALATFRSLSNKWYEGLALENLGRAYEAIGDVTKARTALGQLLELSHSIPDRRLEASALSVLGHLMEVAGDTDGALSNYEQALELNRATEDQLSEVSTLYRIAHVQRTKGQLAAALSKSNAAIKTIEGARATVANSALRASYFASVREQYDLYIDVLMRLHGANGTPSSGVEAFEASERSRARTLLDTISEARLSLTEDVDPTQLEREASLRVLIEAKAEQYRKLLSSIATTRSAEDLGNEIQRLTAEHDELLGQIKIRSPHYAELVRPQPLNLREIQEQVLDADSLLMEYSLGEENSYLWAVTRTEFNAYVLPKRSEIDAKVRRVRELLTARLQKPGEKAADMAARIKREEVEYTRLAGELSQMLLGPVADRLGTQRLVIVGEGVLQYLPFGALPSPESIQSSAPEALIVKHEIVNLPSASTLAVIRKETPNRGIPDRTLAIFADPVFQITDQRVGVTAKPSVPPAQPKAGPSTPRATASPSLSQALRGTDLPGAASLPRLQATEVEARAISAMVPEGSRFVALGFDATKAAATSPDLNRYKFVHMATHTILNENYPDLSSLVMSLVDKNGKPQNGYLRLRDIYNLRLSAELVVLSACETALGKDVKGEGLMSMVRGFMYSGTPRVLASLWKVDDDATAELMTEFYKQLLQNKLTPAAALRQAQITQMQKKSRQSPFFWAAFQLQGEWKP